jgi:hypothetical protein
VLDQPGGSASAAIADTNAGTGRGGSIAGAGFACRIVTGASARPDAASRRLALPGPGQIDPRHSDPARTELRRGDATVAEFSRIAWRTPLKRHVASCEMARQDYP